MKLAGHKLIAAYEEASRFKSLGKLEIELEDHDIMLPKYHGLLYRPHAEHTDYKQELIRSGCYVDVVGFSLRPFFVKKTVHQIVFWGILDQCHHVLE